MKPSKNNKLLAANYRLINLIIIAILAGIFIYSAIYQSSHSQHPIPSYFSHFTRQDSPSTGLSRAFSSLMRFDLYAANQLNPLALQIFLFFLIQLIFRLLSFFLINDRFSLIKSYILTDICLSIIGFLLTFRPLILFTFELFKKFIVN